MRERIASVRRVIFDFFGVICADIAPVVFARYSDDEETRHLMADIVRSAELGFIGQEQMFAQIGTIAGETPAQVAAAFANEAEIDRYMVALIDDLRAEHRIGLLANAVAPLTRQILEESDLAHRFDAVLISSEENLAKPHPAFYRMMMKEMDAGPEDCILIDDDPTHIEGARSVGISGIRFENVEHLRIDLAKRFGITINAPRPYRALVGTVYNTEDA